MITINKAFNTIDPPTKFRVRFKINWDKTLGNGAFFVKVGTTTVYTSPALNDTWYGVDFEITVTESNQSMTIGGSVGSGPVIMGTEILLKDLQIEMLEKAELQDSDMRWAGRRSSYYDGCKMTSSDINVDSPDTVDGGPVIVVNTVTNTVVTSEVSEILNSTDSVIVTPSQQRLLTQRSIVS